MSEIEDRYRHLAEAFAEKVAAVPPERWADPSPCEDWTARELIAHVVESHGMFLGFVGRSLGDTPSVDDDPLGAFRAASRFVEADLGDRGRATAEYDGYFGRMTFEAGVERFLCFDLIVHGWDLARATGLDERIDPGDVAWAMEVAQGFGDAIRGPGAFGPPIEPTPGSDDQSRLLAFLGRRA